MYSTEILRSIGLGYENESKL